MLVDDGRLIADRLAHYHLSEDDVVTAAREQHGLRRLEDVQWAVLEVSGPPDEVSVDEGLDHQ